MKKCDFCTQYDPINNRCVNMDYCYCSTAIEKFLEYQKSINSHTSNKNINIKKRR